MCVVYVCVGEREREGRGGAERVTPDPSQMPRTQREAAPAKGHRTKVWHSAMQRRRPDHLG